MKDEVAILEFTAVTTSAKHVDISIHIGSPNPKDELTHTCSVSIKGLSVEAVEIYGDGTFGALFNGMLFALRMIRHKIEQGWIVCYKGDETALSLETFQKIYPIFTD